MPRSYDDDPPRRSRRRRFDNDEFDDRPRRPPRYDEEDDDYLPSRRRKPDSGAMPMVIVGIVIGAVILLGGFGGLIYLFRAQAKAPQQQANFAAQQPANPPIFVPPGVPRDVVPPELARECVISNLRLTNNGFGGRAALTFDYEFPGGRPFGGEHYVAVVTEPGKQATTANLFGFMAAKDSVSIEHFGGFGTFPRGTTVYIGKGFAIGPNAVPKQISNILTLQ